ncbi:hypothetical protein [Polyangium aurulentum]|uniref:hypothetical protein n=1 Tax=Polyangium aurulentum TaxID=2567896 RepID=UPI0010ADA739|nr:hypothetical protein [Polyangium aurulentum]UQA59643.1 hypothetical protein E8A73_003820 [Polyangium aurulentum]
MAGTALGIDLACRRWKDVGSALVAFDARRWIEVRPGAIAWPHAEELKPRALARTIDEFATANEVRAIALDGPQAWRDPAAAPRRGVGRSCEYATRTPGKTGTFGKSYPGTWLGWVGFCIEVFDELLAMGRARRVNEALIERIEAPEPPGYLVLECFPTSTWRASGLRSLPGHAKARGQEERWAGMLRGAFDLPEAASTRNHDDLQAVVAAVVAAAVIGGPAEAIASGEPCRACPAGQGWPAHRVEGFIYDARPKRSPLP